MPGPAEISETNNRQQEILINSAHLFCRKGYVATGIRDIAEAVGINSASLYYYFKNKDEILLEAIRFTIDLLHQSVEEAMETRSGLLEKFKAGMQAHLETSIAYQDLAAVLWQEARHLSPENQRRVIEKRDAYESMWAGLLEEAQEAGLIKPEVNLHMLRLLSFGSMNWVATWYRPDGEYTLSEIADQFFNLMGYGVVNG